MAVLDDIKREAEPTLSTDCRRGFHSMCGRARSGCSCDCHKEERA